ncbi:MAG: four helix bundle protein [Planctomycetota bacterium]
MQFDHEKLDVYQLELPLLSWVTELIDEVRNTHGAKAREPLDHLDRGSLSTLFNTAEGNGKRQRRVRAKFFDDARGSGTECAACLDALVAKGFCKSERVARGKELLFRIVSMLSKLVDRFSGGESVREEGAPYETASEETEDEDDDEDEDEND